MKEFIKKFDIPASADNYAIVDIPFITTIQSTGQNLRCAVKWKKIVVVDNVMTIESVVPRNEIWYTTTDGNPYPLEQIILGLSQIGATYNGPSVISNEWDVDKQMFVMRFDSDVTVVGDANLNTMVVNGPFFATYEQYGILCNIKTIILPNSVTSIGAGAFFGCTSLTSINIPENVISIGENAFFSCTSLTSITIPNSVTSIGNSAFNSCTSLTSINIPNSVTSIGNSTFNSCTSLTSINIPDSVTSIGEWAFGSCDSLTSITIPVGVTSIGKNAFTGCSSLQSITCLPTVPPILGGPSSIPNTNNCPIYVPAQSVDAYKAAANWSSYKTRIQAIQ